MYMCTYTYMNEMPCKRELDYLEWIGFWFEYFLVYFCFEWIFFRCSFGFLAHAVTTRSSSLMLWRSKQCVAVCCSVLHCVAMCCCVL